MKKPHRPKWDARTSVAQNARRELPRLVSVYFAHVRDLLAANPSPAELHAVRLATKRLRYTIELFRACYGPGLEDRLATLRHIQQLLGEVNDGACCEAFLARTMRPSAMRIRLLDFLAKAAEERAEVFRQAWAGEFDSAGQELWWTQYLARQAREPGRAIRSSRRPTPDRRRKTPPPAQV